MKIAITVWGNKISPVFETAEHLLLVDIVDAVEQNRELIKMNGLLPVQKITLLEDLNVQLLVCGAITRELESSFDANKVKIISFVCGNVEQLISAVSHGEPVRDMFGMPGGHNS